MNCTTELLSVIAADCNDPSIAGTYGDVILVPYDAIDRTLTKISGATGGQRVISELVLKSGRQGYSFAAFDNSVLGAASLNAGTYKNNFQHDLTLRVFVKNTTTKTFVNLFANARVVAIVKNKNYGSNGEDVYETYGFDSGLKLNTLTSDTTMADGVVYELVLGNDETSKEKSLPISVFDTSLSTTETMLSSLVDANFVDPGA
jgi:hypothetical protein